MGYCRAIGLDIMPRMQERLIDLVIGGDAFKLEPWETFAALCHRQDLPYYACLDVRRIQETLDPEAKPDLKIWRGEAPQAWKAGVDAIYIFDQFDPTLPIWRELGDPKLLATLERTERTTFVNPELGHFSPEGFLKGGNAFVRAPKAAAKSPR